ncbi:MAG: hypothetical protein QNJ13_17580 [Paracoccaceae bacterium]|nr:hypothetical protein [Paracoccaceae bacterium]
MKTLASLGATISVALLATAAQADRFVAQSLAEKARAAFDAGGFEATCDAIRQNADGAWREGDSHVRVLSPERVIICDGVNTALEGFDVDNLVDPEGTNVGAVIAALPEGGSFAEWQMENPNTNEIDTQITYIIKSDDLIIGVGAFE